MRPLRSCPQIPAVGCAALVAALLSGCREDAPAEPEVSYEQPAWMAEEALIRERYVTTWTDCMREHGQAGEVAPDGGSHGTFPPDMDDEARQAAVSARIAASAACQERVAEFQPDEPPSWDLVYERAVDTDACLRHEGYPDLPQPPSGPVFVEQWSTAGGGGDMGTGPPGWMPFAVLHEHQPDIEAQEWYRLKAVCTEFWLRYTVAIGEDGP